MAVYVIDPNGHLQQDQHNGAAWTGWTPVDDSTRYVGEPAVVASASLVTIVAREADGRLRSLGGTTDSWRTA